MRAVSTLTRLFTIPLILLAVDFFGEIVPGIPSISAPEIATDFAESPGLVAGWLLASANFLPVIVGPPILIMADRYSRKWLVSGSLVGMGLVCVTAGLSPKYWVLLLSLLLWGAVREIGVHLTEGTLSDMNPDVRERMMARWTLSGTIGDLTAPLFIFSLSLIGWGWREAFLTCGFLLIGYGIWIHRQKFPRKTALDDEEELSFLATIKAALSNSRLLLWSSAVILWELQDKILVAFGSIYLQQSLDADLATRSAIFTALVVGVISGLVAIDFILSRIHPVKLLFITSATGALLYFIWLTISSPVLNGIILFLFGFTTAGFFPIIKSQSYRSMPGQSGAVNAVASLFTVFEIILPSVIGLVAYKFGLLSSMIIIGFGPVAICLIAGFSLRQQAS